MAKDAYDNDLIHPELSYKLVGCFYRVHNDLGKYCRERQYADKLEEVFIEQGVAYERERYIQNSGNCVDFLVEDAIIIEIKAKQKIDRDDYYQTQRYLQSRGISGIGMSNL